MPPAAAFDYYNTLEVSRTATVEEITRSYRRLALIHHPDKNSGNPEATARFQQISEAYETLSDENARQRYDNPPRPSFAGFSPQGFDDSDFVSEQEINDFLFRVFFGGMEFEGYERDDIAEAIRAERRAQAEAEEANIRAERAQRRARAEEVDRKREAKKAAKKAEKQQKLDDIATMHKKERALAEEHWTANNAVTPEDKQAACSHSVFWPSEKLRAKVKCQSCRQKGGIMAYKCPHCALVVCGNCHRKFLETNNQP